MLPRRVGYHARCTNVGLRRAEQNDGTSAEAACTITAGERKRFLLGHSTRESSDKVDSALDVDIDHLGEQIDIEKWGKGLVRFQINLQSPIISDP